MTIARSLWTMRRCCSTRLLNRSRSPPVSCYVVAVVEHTTNRFLSSNSSSDKDSYNNVDAVPYHSYEYPWATEPPVITRITAAEAAAKAAAGNTAIDTAAAADGEASSNSSSSSGSTDDSATPMATTPSSSSDKTKPSLFSWLGSLFSPSQSTPSTKTATSTDDSSNTSRSSSSGKGLLETIASVISRMERDGDVKDPFDDSASLSPAEIEARRQQQKQQLSTKLSTLEPVAKTVPAYIPPNVPATELATPETIITVLDNGIRVVSQETYGQVSTVGVVSELGSRHETPANTGIANLLELTAFGAADPSYESAAAVAHQLQDWGGTRFVSTGREQSIHCIDLLRPNVANAVGMLSDVLLRPQFLPNEIDEAKQAVQFQSLPEHMPPELLLSEALQKAAYGIDQQLGKPHFCPVDTDNNNNNALLSGLTRDTAVQYWQTQFLQNPAGMVIGGAGVQHDELVQLAQKHFGHLQQNDTGRIRTIPSVYRGGSCRVQLPVLHLTNNTQGEEILSDNEELMSVVTAEQRLTRVAVALEVGGWHSEHLVTACVLQTLLGGGSSFSAGGPGKGMYSRLYRQVLNQYRWAESAEAFTAFHADSGLVGISGSTQPNKARDMVQVFCHHLSKLAVEPVSAQELDRARNMLKNNVLTQLESRLILFEDMARQVLTYGKREHVRETCEKINAVTAADVQAMAETVLQKPPTVAAVGVDVQYVPQQEEVVQWLQR